MEIRRTPAGTEELAALVPAFAGLWVRMLEECDLLGSGLVDDWHERLVAHFSAELRRGSMALYFAKAGDAVVGSAAVLLKHGTTSAILRDRSATIAGVYVEPAYRRRGLARALTESAIAWARAQGCVSVRLITSRGGEPLYRSLGFEDGNELVLKLEP